MEIKKSFLCYLLPVKNYNTIKIHFILRFFIPLFAVISYSSAHNCYVCGEGADEPFYKKEQQQKGSNNNKKDSGGNNKTVTQIPLKCDEFERSDVAQLDKFARECPNGYNSCLTQIEGKWGFNVCLISQTYNKHTTVCIIVMLK